jgi:hypothetical protein
MTYAVQDQKTCFLCRRCREKVSLAKRVHSDVNLSAHDSEVRIKCFPTRWLRQTAQMEVVMRITILASDDPGTDLETDQELRRAFEVLRNALIRTRGGGRFADSRAAIILSPESDAAAALAALGQAGIRALPAEGDAHTA